MLPVLQYASLLWPNPMSTSSARASRRDPPLLRWFAFCGIKVAAQPPSPRTAMYIAVLFARAHIERQRALAVPAGTAVTIASVRKVLLDCPLVPKLAAPKELSNSAVCYDTSLVRSMCSFFCDV